MKIQFFEVAFWIEQFSKYGFNLCDTLKMYFMAVARIRYFLVKYVRGESSKEFYERQNYFTRRQNDCGLGSRQASILIICPCTGCPRLVVPQRNEKRISIPRFSEVTLAVKQFSGTPCTWSEFLNCRNQKTPSTFFLFTVSHQVLDSYKYKYLIYCHLQIKHQHGNARTTNAYFFYFFFN